MRISTRELQRMQPKVSETLQGKSLFDGLDTTKSGSIDMQQFNAFAKSLGLDGTAIFKKLDIHHKGKINFTQFSRGLPQLESALFTQLDSQKTGSLDQTQIEAFSKKYNLDPKKVLQALDSNKNGKISKTEFLNNFKKILSDPQSFASNSLSQLTEVPPSSRVKTTQQQPIDSKNILAELEDQPNKLDIFW